MKRRCVLVIPDAGPINSLWVARRLDLLLKLEMPVVLIDEVYAETTRDPDHYAKDRDVQSFVEAHRDREILVEKTFVGSSAAVARARGDKLKSNLGDAAIAEFLNDANEGSGINKYLQSDEPVLLLFEDADLRSTKFIKKTDNLHLLSTVAFLRGMEAVGLIESAQEVIQAMTNPSNPRESRKLNDLPDGTEDRQPLETHHQGRISAPTTVATICPSPPAKPWTPPAPAPNPCAANKSPSRKNWTGAATGSTA